MRCIIAGKRDFTDKGFVFAALDAVFSEIGRPDEIIEGGATGVDALGKQYARERSIPFRTFQADWDKYGRAAGPIRNRQMAEYAAEDPDGNGVLIAFSDGQSRGTQSMIAVAKRLGLTIKCVAISGEQ